VQAGLELALQVLDGIETQPLLGHVERAFVQLAGERTGLGECWLAIHPPAAEAGAALQAEELSQLREELSILQDRFLHGQLATHIRAGNHLLDGGLGDPGGAQACAAAISTEINLHTHVVSHAELAGVAELQGIDGLIPVAAGPAGVGIKPCHEALGAAQLQLRLKG